MVLELRWKGRHICHVKVCFEVEAIRVECLLLILHGWSLVRHLNYQTIILIPSFNYFQS
jgi:hypothetical protein